MKKILITGAAGALGIQVIANLLEEKHYEITALDLKNKTTSKRLKKYKKRINIIYGDVNNSVLIDTLVKGHDIVINLCTVMPPLADYRKDLCEIIEIGGTENIIRAINYFNPKCTLIYTSTTSLYGASSVASTENKINKKELTPYSLTKIRVEELIKKNLENYVIFRIPLILNYIKHEPFMFNIKNNIRIECITNKDAASLLVKSLSNIKKLNNNIYNAGGGEEFRINYKVIRNNVLKYYGINFKYILSKFFLEKNYYSPVLTDSDKLNDIIKYRIDSIDNYNQRLKRRSKFRGFQKLIGKIIIKVTRKK